MLRPLRILFTLLSVIGLSGAAFCDAILTVETGQGTRSFNLPELESMDRESFTTTTIWTEGEQTFTGVPLDAFLNEVGITTGTLEAHAVDDYLISFPVDEARTHGPIIAYMMNGKPMSVRDWGPLWIVYPYDSSKDFQKEVVYARSVWQLQRFVIRN